MFAMFSTLMIAAQQQGGLGTILFLVPMFGLLYFFMIRPQQKRMKKQATLQKDLAEGDEVITTSGIYGFITGFEGDIVWLEIDDNIQIRVARAAVQRKVDTSVTATEEITKGSTDIADIVAGDENDK
jgi:preprotein translocase subunit YajC